jgi:tetratricopeptide (TPR) repeat protein
VLRRHLAERVFDEERDRVLDRIGELAERRGEASRDAITDMEVRGELTSLAALAQALDEAGRTAAGVSLTNWISESLRQLGRASEARALVERFVDSPRQDAAGPREAANLLTCLALTLVDTDELAEARRRIKQAIEIQERHAPRDHPALASSYSNLATILRGQGELPEARRRIEQAIAIEEQYFPLDHPTLAISYSNLATILAQQGELPEARRRMEQAIGIREKKFSLDYPPLAISYSNLGEILRALGDTVAACALFRRAESILRKHFPPEHPHRVIVSRKVSSCGEEPGT